MITPQTCPVCNLPVGPQTTAPAELFPFCSPRCRSVDLFRWSEGKYAIVENISERADLLEDYLEEVDKRADELEVQGDDDSGW
ncbi:DNA gyrase inhibitor YacG [bacterium]|nr:DNA gyrase inhibitor YacG [bacterium]